MSSTRLGLESMSQQVTELNSKVREVSEGQEEIGSDVKRVSKKVGELHSLRTQSVKQLHRHSGAHSGSHHVCRYFLCPVCMCTCFPPAGFPIFCLDSSVGRLAGGTECS